MPPAEFRMTRLINPRNFPYTPSWNFVVLIAVMATSLGLCLTQPNRALAAEGLVSATHLDGNLGFTRIREPEDHYDSMAGMGFTYLRKINHVFTLGAFAKVRQTALVDFYGAGMLIGGGFLRKRGNYLEGGFAGFAIGAGGISDNRVVADQDGSFEDLSGLYAGYIAEYFRTFKGSTTFGYVFGLGVEGIQVSNAMDSGETDTVSYTYFTLGLLMLFP